MVEPSLDQFGLSESDFKALQRFDEHSWAKIGCLFIALSALAGGIYAAAQATSVGEFIGGVVLFAVQGIGISIPPMLVLGATWDRIAGLFSRRVRAYSGFQRAKREYDAWLLRTKQQFWLGLPGLSFESELAVLYRRLGYQVELTPASGDKGVDLVLRRDGRTTIVQCKATRKPVGPNIARELYGTLMEMRADDAILASLAGCTAGVRDFIRDKPIRLLTLDEIVRMQDRTADKTLE
jgi:hypothetical protein